MENPAGARSLGDLARQFAVYAAVARARAARLAHDPSTDAVRESAVLRRQAWAYHVVSLRAAAVADTRAGWLLAYLDSRAAEPVTGPCYAAMAAEVRASFAARR